MSKSVNKMLLTIYIAVPSHEYTFYIKQEHVVAGLCESKHPKMHILTLFNMHTLLKGMSKFCS